MSRIGKIPVKVPSGVDIHADGADMVVKGPKGELRQELTGGVTLEVADGEACLQRPSDEQSSRALHGLYRALLQNMVVGVTDGYERRLEVVGVSYQASVQGDTLRLQVGFSHPVDVAIPKSLTITTPSTTQIVVQGIDKQAVGQFAATVRRVQPPEPYKGKGIRYLGEEIIRKAGKSFVGGEK